MKAAALLLVSIVCVWPSFGQYSVERDGDVIRLRDGRSQTVVSVMPSHGNSAFDMTVRAIRHTVGDAASDELTSCGGPDGLDDMLRQADFVVVAMPATAETIGSIGIRQLGLMKPTAFLINVARAQIVDEAALYDALARGSIAGAALDVWYRYPGAPGLTPPANLPFNELPNVLMTPHVSGWTDGMIEARAGLIAENIRRVAEGEELLNLVV